MRCGTVSIRSTSRKIAVPAANPSVVARAIASRASVRPCAASTRDAEQLEPARAMGAEDLRVIRRTRARAGRCRFRRDDALLALFAVLVVGAAVVVPHVCWPT